METPKTPRPLPPQVDLEARTAALRKIQMEMQFLHARLEYFRLMLRLNVRQR